MRIISLLAASAIFLSTSGVWASPVAKKEFLDLYRTGIPWLSEANINLSDCVLSTSIDQKKNVPGRLGETITRTRILTDFSMYDFSRPVLHPTREVLGAIAKRREISNAMIEDARTFFALGGSTRSIAQRRASSTYGSKDLDTLSDDEIIALLEKHELEVWVYNRRKTKVCPQESELDKDGKSLHTLIQSLEGSGLKNITSIAAYREPSAECAVYGVVQIPRSFGMVAPDRDHLLSLFKTAQDYKRTVCPDDTTKAKAIRYTGTGEGPGQLCNGELIADFETGENKGWAAFLGVWRTMRETNNPRYPGANEEVTLTLSLKDGTTADDANYVWRYLSRVVIKDNGKRSDSAGSGNYANASNLRGSGFVEGTSPNIVAMRIDGDTLHYVGFSPDPGCVVMDFNRVN